MYMCTYISFLPHVAMCRFQQFIKFRIGIPKRLGTSKFVRTTSHVGSIAFEGMLLGSSLPAGRREAAQPVLKFTHRVKIGISTP